MNKCGIYKITNIVNGKAMIGQSRNIEKRWRNHKNRARLNKHESTYFQNAWNKYGENNFIFTILLECSPKKLNKEEIKLIKQYDATNRNKGYNIEGGGGGAKMSEETKRKISKARMGKHYLTEEAKKRIGRASSKRNKGINNPNYGKCHSIETKKKMSELKRGKYSGEKHPNYGKHLSEETKRKISKANKQYSGEKHPCFGTHHSKATRQKMKKAWERRKLFMALADKRKN